MPCASEKLPALLADTCRVARAKLIAAGSLDRASRSREPTAHRRRLYDIQVLTAWRCRTDRGTTYRYRSARPILTPRDKCTRLVAKRSGRLIPFVVTCRQQNFCLGIESPASAPDAPFQRCTDVVWDQRVPTGNESIRRTACSPRTARRRPARRNRHSRRRHQWATRGYRGLSPNGGGVSRDSRRCSVEEHLQRASQSQPSWKSRSPWIRTPPVRRSGAP